MNCDCAYIADGQTCDREATTSRIVPVRSDLPGPDWYMVPLCHRHAQAAQMWQYAEAVRRAG